MPARTLKLHETGFYLIHYVKLQTVFLLTLPKIHLPLLRQDQIVVRPPFILEGDQIIQKESGAILVIAPRHYHQQTLDQLSLPNRKKVEDATLAVELNAQGQLPIPETLVKATGLTPKDKLVVVGCGQHCELWREADWESYKIYLDDPITRAELQRRLAKLGL